MSAQSLLVRRESCESRALCGFVSLLEISRATFQYKNTIGSSSLKIKRTLAAPAPNPQLLSTRIACESGHSLDPGRIPFAELFGELSRQSPASAKLANSLCTLISTCICTLAQSSPALSAHCLPQAPSEQAALSRSFRGPSFRKTLSRAFAMQSVSLRSSYLGNRLDKIIVGVLGAAQMCCQSGGGVMKPNSTFDKRNYVCYIYAYT